MGAEVGSTERAFTVAVVEVVLPAAGKEFVVVAALLRGQGVEVSNGDAMLVQPGVPLGLPLSPELKRDRIGGAPGDEVGAALLLPMWEEAVSDFHAFVWIEGDEVHRGRFFPKMKFGARGE